MGSRIATSRTRLFNSRAGIADRRRKLDPLPAPPCNEVYAAEADFIRTHLTSLDDAQSLRIVLNGTSLSCRPCILSAVASVCGKTCAREHLHLMLDHPLELQTDCQPELSSRLFAAQAALLADAVHSQEPFGLSAASPVNIETRSDETVLISDLFLPTSETVHGQPVLRGMDTNRSLFACSRTGGTDAWIITSSGDRSSWALCQGDVLIDRSSGKAQLIAGSEESSSVVLTFVVHRGFGGACGSALRSGAMSSATYQGGTLAFSKMISAADVACWLARLFGPQSAMPSTSLPSAIELQEGLGSVRLLVDLVIPRNRSLIVRGGGNTIVAGSHQSAGGRKRRFDA